MTFSARGFAAALVLVLSAAVGAQQVGQAISPDRLASRARFPDWDARDLEGRWALLTADRDRDPDADLGWTAYLAEQGEHELLEWLVITRATGWSAARQALVAADAPGWIRATALHLDSTDSHAREAAGADLRANPAVFLGWVELHGARVDEVTRRFAATVPGQPDVEAARAALLPYTDEQLFGGLARAAEAVPFGDRATAEPGVVYVSQVERSIDAAGALRRHPPQLVERLLAATGVDDRRLAQSAALAFSEFPASEVPSDALWALAADTHRPAAVREAALLSATYGNPARAYVSLHALAVDPGHAHWRASLSRLAELGDGFSLLELEALPVDELGPVDRAFADDALRRLRARVDRPRALAERVRPLLENAAWADLMCAPIEHRLLEWTVQQLRAAGDDPALVSALRALAASYEPGPAVSGTTLFGDMQGRVRSYASELLAGR